jgi:hypothetical protein
LSVRAILLSLLRADPRRKSGTESDEGSANQDKLPPLAVGTADARKHLTTSEVSLKFDQKSSTAGFIAYESCMTSYWVFPQLFQSDELKVSFGDC